MMLYAYAALCLGIACGTMVVCILAGMFDARTATRPRDWNDTEN